MSQIPASAEIKTHVYNEALEGPLPDSFPTVGREGKIRNIYEAAEKICMVFSDRVSAFDQVSPTPVPGKGVVLNDIAQRELKAAERSGIATWLDYVPEDNPRVAVGINAEVIPVEMIFRNYMTGSMWREYKKEGDYFGFGLPNHWSEWHSFTDRPLFTPTTKSEHGDQPFHPRDVEAVTGVEPSTLGQMEDICRELFRIGTARAAAKGLILVDTKYEVGLSPDKQMIIIDEVHTPDSSRFVMQDGFDEAIADDVSPRSLSKEFLRQIILAQVDFSEPRAKARMADPLTPEIVTELIERYQQLHRIFTQ